MMLSLKYFVMYLLLVFLCLLLRVTLGIGSFASSYQTICKDDDAFLIWPNIPANVRNKAVYKGETLAVAWSQEGGFTESPSYKGRLKQKGENAFWIIKANQSDSGTYKLIYNSPATDISEESFNLQVIVPPSNYCIPNITREQDTLWAKLPQDDCGIPMLKPKWMNGTEITIMGNIAVLNARVQPGTYIACANGTALQCYKGNSDTLCANYTLHEPDSKQESGSMMVTTIIVSLPISIFLIIVGVILICCFRWKSRRKKLSAGTVSERFEMIDVSCERQTLIRDETSAKDLVDIKRHLIHQYKALKSPDFSSSGKLKLPELSPMYFDLEITSLRMEHFGDRGNMSAASLQDIFSICKRSTNSAKHLQPIPAVIMGKCGIGKSTWCKKNC
ncbi:hypothetical protein CHS0354_032890 [Potamilus streckersoni]|uniref:Uncharacterized protein n=1 Tax=Potamilus streckersoni TaxID=2493646 RepID=A0AAE0RWJ5_9BIVA|nr:hypothetical protein CHS0354_032890 [Potamilus streckersoni]